MTFNKLTVVNEDVGTNRFDQKLWLCRCECGATTLAIASAVRHGHTKSCGCLQAAGNHRTHGQSARVGGLRSKAYSAWMNMRNRCESQKNPKWHDYGGRGITVDPGWAKFEAFYEDMGAPPPGFSIDRIDNNGNYTKANCQWADKSTQRRNKRPGSRGGHLVWCDIHGERLILTDAVKKYGQVPYTTAVNRLFYGWTPEDAVLTPYTRGFAHTPSAGVRYEWNGKSQTLGQWSRETGIGRVTILKRLQRGWPVARALTEAPAY